MYIYIYCKCCYFWKVWLLKWENELRKQCAHANRLLNQIMYKAAVSTMLCPHFSRHDSYMKHKESNKQDQHSSRITIQFMIHCAYERQPGSVTIKQTALFIGPHHCTDREGFTLKVSVLFFLSLCERSYALCYHSF